MKLLDLPDDDAVEQAAAKVAALRPFLVRAQKAVPLAGEVSVLLTSDREIRRLNRTFRHKDKATDVLSFPAPEFPKNIAGDLAISLDTATRQAAQFGHTLDVELKILLLHGLLHLAGFDHEADKGEMAEREEELRRRFRLPSTLIARTVGSTRGRR
jgi:probable rRNA maturation factor